MVLSLVFVEGFEMFYIIRWSLRKVDMEHIEKHLIRFTFLSSDDLSHSLPLLIMGFLEQPQILGGAQCTPPISYACSTWAILMKL